MFEGIVGGEGCAERTENEGDGEGKMTWEHLEI